MIGRNSTRYRLAFLSLFILLPRVSFADSAAESTEPFAAQDALLKGVAPSYQDQLFIRDYNADGEVEVVAFGDSMTRGTGDFTAVGETVENSFQPTTEEAGYPLRVETLLGIPVTNLGIAGDELTLGGLSRYARSIPAQRPDVVLIMGGSNDVLQQSSPATYFHSIQAMINIARAVGAEPVLVNLPPTCCNHSGLSVGVTDFNAQLLRASVINGVPLSDTNHAFRTTCNDVEECNLTNLPEGLHPNIAGYDVIGETLIATLLQINIFASDGAAQLEQALMLPAGSVKTKPDAPAA